MTLEDYLRKDAKLYPDKTAVVCGDAKRTYRQLYDEAMHLAQQIQVQGKPVVFRTSQSIEFLVTYFAIHMAGGVAVPQERTMPDELFESYRQQFHAAVAPQGTADILYTTGTTGKQKGVIISHRAIIANAENLIEAQGFHHDLTFIINGPLNHIGSLSKVYPVILTGGTLHIIDGMKDINRFFQAIDQSPHRVATFLVPASIRMLLAFSANQLSQYANRIEFIETGAAPIAQSDMQKLCDALPQSRLFNTYASTETGIISTFNYNDGECLAGCLGRPMKHSEIIIMPDEHIACAGETLMTGYWNDAEQTESILQNGILHTADLGHIDKQGRLHLSGRDGDIINVGGYKIAPTEVEDAAMSLPSVKDCICIASHHPVLGTVLKLLVVIAEGYTFDKRAIAKALQQRLESYKIPMQYEQVSSIARTYNGKIDRKQYREL